MQHDRVREVALDPEVVKRDFKPEELLRNEALVTSDEWNGPYRPLSLAAFWIASAGKANSVTPGSPEWEPALQTLMNAIAEGRVELRGRMRKSGPSRLIDGRQCSNCRVNGPFADIPLALDLSSNARSWMDCSFPFDFRLWDASG